MIGRLYIKYIYILESEFKRKNSRFRRDKRDELQSNTGCTSGRYWVVYGYDEFGDGLGFTNGFTLYVTNP